MIQIEKLLVQFKTKVVLDHIDLILGNGHIYGLLGKNGEGKTTLLRVLSGLIFPDGGKCIINDFVPKERKTAFLNQIYMVPEEPVFRAMQVQRFFDEYTPFYSTFSSEILAECVKLFEINTSERLDKLSMGQRKKVALSFALAVNTPVLLLDEPTNGLDIPSKSVFRKLMASLMTDDRCVIISTHQVRDLENLIDSVVILDQRQVLLNKTMSEISEKLAFKKMDDGDDILFAENGILSQIGVVRNINHEETAIDMELLFEAVINRKEEIKKIFG